MRFVVCNNIKSEKHVHCFQSVNSDILRSDLWKYEPDDLCEPEKQDGWTVRAIESSSRRSALVKYQGETTPEIHAVCHCGCNTVITRKTIHFRSIIVGGCTAKTNYCAIIFTTGNGTLKKRSRVPSRWLRTFSEHPVIRSGSEEELGNITAINEVEAYLGYQQGAEYNNLFGRDR